MSFIYKVLSLGGLLLIETNSLAIAKETAISQHGTLMIRMFNGVYHTVGTF